MTIRGTSNQTTMTVTQTITSQGWESCVGRNAADGGGAGFPVVGASAYRQSDNASPGYTFTPSGDHLPLGTAQVDYTAP